MFGICRYILSTLVVFSHLWMPKAPWAGAYSVCMFIMISGYLTMHVRTKTYGFNFQGGLRFAFNRVLRIFPAYYAVLLLALAMLLFIPESIESTPLSRVIHFPQSFSSWLQNIFIINGLSTGPTRLVPPAWFLEGLICYYIVMSFLPVYKRKLAFCWCGLSIAFTLYVIIAGYDFELRYRPILAMSLMFSMGVTCYHIHKRFEFLGKWHLIIATTLFFINMFGPQRIFKNAYMDGFYINMVICSYLLLCLSNIRIKDLPPWFAKVDRTLGNISYPIYLCHFHVACLLRWAGLPVGNLGEARMFLISLPFINVLSYFINIVVEQQANKIRDRVKKR